MMDKKFDIEVRSRGRGSGKVVGMDFARVGSEFIFTTLHEFNYATNEWEISIVEDIDCEVIDTKLHEPRKSIFHGI